MGWYVARRAMPKEIHEARVDYKLLAVDNQAKPRLASSARASSSALGASAIRLATFAGSTYINLMPGGTLYADIYRWLRWGWAQRRRRRCQA